MYHIRNGTKENDYSVLVNPRNPHIEDILAVTRKISKELMVQKRKEWELEYHVQRHRGSKDILFEEIQVIQDHCHERKELQDREWNRMDYGDSLWY